MDKLIETDSIPKTLKIAENQQFIGVFNALADSEITINKDSDSTIIAVLNAGWQGKKTITFNFTGENSTLNFIAIIIGKDSDSFDFETISNHQVAHTKGRYNIRSAMFEQSKIDYKGNLIIGKGGQQTDSYLAHHSLMMSPDATTDTKPSLEIEASDVKAGHAATIGNIDEDMLFYLESRGLTQTQSQELMVKGFLTQDLTQTNNPDLEKSLTETISHYLHARR